MKTLLILITLGILLTGCATGGSKKMGADELARIKPGQTTKTELIQWFGSPVAQGLDTSGKTSLQWHHVEVHAAPFWSEVKNQMLSVILDTNNVVEKFVVTDDLNKPAAR